jgi:glutaconate CoA-transferase subunit B
MSSNGATQSTAATADAMAVALARLLHDGERVFHGVASPLPMVAILLAMRVIGS